MKNVFASLVAVLAAAGFAVAQGPQVNTPGTPVECVPTQIVWTGGVPPFTLLVQSPDANGPAIQIYSGLQSSPFTWPTNVTAGTSVGFTVRDNTGAPGQTAPVTVQAGPSSSCIGSGASSGSPPGSSTSSTPAGSSTSSSASTPGGSSTSSSSSSSSTSKPASGSSSSSSAAPSPTGASGNGALANAAAMGAVGFVGALVAAVIA